MPVGTETRDSPQPRPLSRKAERARSAEAAYRVAVRTAAVAGVFCLVVVSAIVLRLQPPAVRRTPCEATILKALKADCWPGSRKTQALKEQVRVLDLELRRKYMRQRAFAAGGAVLLLGGIVVLLAAATSAATLRRKLPLPQPLEPGRDRAGAVDAAGPLGGRRRWAWCWPWRPGVLIARCGPLPRQATSQARGQSRFRTDARVARRKLGQPPSAEEIARAWPRFRGPGGSGISAYANVPESWDGRSGKNILWKTPVPLPGNSSPVVWGNRVFLSGADARRTARSIASTRPTAGSLWRKEVPADAGSSQPCKVRRRRGLTPRPPWRPTAGWRWPSSPTATSAAFDFDGKLVWSRSLGVPDNTYGHAASLAIFRDLLLVPMDQGHAGSRSRSKLLALDLATGKTVWQQPRETPNSWSSPIVIHAAGRDQLITTGDPWVIAYELPGGGELWRAKCLYGEIGPSPVFANGLVYAAGERDRPGLRPLRPTARAT